MKVPPLSRYITGLGQVPILIIGTEYRVYYEGSEDCGNQWWLHKSFLILGWDWVSSDNVRYERNSSSPNEDITRGHTFTNKHLNKHRLSTWNLAVHKPFLLLCCSWLLLSLNEIFKTSDCSKKSEVPVWAACCLLTYGSTQWPSEGRGGRAAWAGAG